MIPVELENVIVSNSDILGGTPCFKGTRVPLETFLDYIGTGSSLDRFLQGFPSVHKDQTLSVLEWETNQAKNLIGLSVAPASISVVARHV